jgi:hypothetical protein
MQESSLIVLVTFSTGCDHSHILTSLEETMIDREKDVVEWVPIPPRPRRKRLMLLIACAILLLVCTYGVGRPKDPDGLLGPLVATRIKFGGTNACDGSSASVPSRSWCWTGEWRRLPDTFRSGNGFGAQDRR